jgi:hypothetical protein
MISRPIQDLLYLHASTFSPASEVIAMTLMEGGEQKPVPEHADDWPYQTVLQAVADGWRIVCFPEMSLVTTNDDDLHGLGHLFVLERYG